MNKMDDSHHRSLLRDVAHRAMRDRGLEPDFPRDAIAQLDGMHQPAEATDESIRDLRHRIWCSIDNDDSLDIDQLSVAEALPDGGARILVAIADVDVLVEHRSPIDEHACYNTTSVYTAAEIFPMLPEKLSTDLTSLNYDSDRLVTKVALICW